MTDHGDNSSGHLFLPDFCAIRTVFLVVIIAELQAFIITFAGSGPLPQRLDGLGLISLYVQWIALACAALLCLLRPALARASEATVSVVAYGTMLAVTYALCEAAWWVAHLSASAGSLIAATHGEFVARSLAISAIVCALALRYFYVRHHWQRRIESEGQARIQALQARIRPHFFFNCMNTIASLTRSRPQAAEKAVEDLADLFRASLADARAQVSMAEELQLCRQYLDIEKLRLGERLQIDWETDALPADALLPALTLQPLIENAIYHGVEPQPGGGTVRVRGSRSDGTLQVVIENPLAAGTAGSRHDGNRLAQDNVRERLGALYGPAGKLRVESGEDLYRVTLTLPYAGTQDDADIDR